MKYWSFIVVSFLTIGLIFAGCSSDDKGTNSNGGDQLIEESIGPAGGTIEMTGEAALEIPVGAVVDTVDFSMEENDSPEALGGTSDFVSTVVTIGPAGTQFNIPATITIDYNESNLGGGSEDDITIYTNDGDGWVALTTTVDTDSNRASAEVTHLSDFGAGVDTVSTEAEGIFTALTVHRGVVYVEYERQVMKIRTDFLMAWFDSTWAPCEPEKSCHPDSVHCNEYVLEWSNQEDVYKYMQLVETEFLELGETYTYHVYGNDEVPSLDADIEFPQYEPVLTDPTMNDTLSLSGFDISWDGGGGGTLSLALMTTTGDTSVLGVFLDTENDGSHTYTASDLNNLTPGAYVIVLNMFNYENIDAEGYDPRSFIEAMVTNSTMIYLEE
ncbi:MAG: hypothetical protein GF315_06690 [candidate division Zixibacteria bacterium]|nr:hypothetical protein [candidate division Zixibacteria bacterium]